MSAAIETRRLVKRFGKGEGAVTALAGLDLDVSEGELFGLIGPNGSGKTTLIRILNGLEPATDGVALLGGRPPGALAPRVGYMPQEEALYLDLSVRENVEFFAGLYAPADAARVDEVIEFVRLTESRDRLVGDLSGGMRRRASLASTLAHRPTLLFLDEPTVGVDPLLRMELWERFRQIAHGGAAGYGGRDAPEGASTAAILITTHHMEEARRCDRIGFIHKGRMLVVGPTDELLREAGAENLEDAFLHYQRRAGVA